MLYFESFADFIAMGGHGAFVWSCYLIVGVGLIAQFISAKKSVNHAKHQIAVFYRRQSARHTPLDELDNSKVDDITEGTK